MSDLLANLIFDGVMVPENARIKGLSKAEVKDARDVAYEAADRMSVMLSMIGEDEENAPQVSFMASAADDVAGLIKLGTALSVLADCQK